MKRILLSSVAIIGMTTAAMAADLYEPVIEEVPYVATPEAFSWTGLYFGVHGGWGWADGSAEYANDPELNEECPFDEGPGCALGLDPEGAFVGAQIGYQYQFGNWVLGIEGDYSAASLTDDGSGGEEEYNTHVDLDIDQIASVRGRVGYAMGQWLPFATLGWGWAHAERSVFNSAAEVEGSDDQWHDGFTVGAGVEYAINQHWSIKGEYRFYDHGDENYTVPTLNGDGTDVDLDLHTVSFGVNYRF